jgi:hypothetical protein
MGPPKALRGGGKPQEATSAMATLKLVTTSGNGDIDGSRVKLRGKQQQEFGIYDGQDVHVSY